MGLSTVSMCWEYCKVTNFTSEPCAPVCKELKELGHKAIEYKWAKGHNMKIGKVTIGS
jgi:hypothetical protein